MLGQRKLAISTLCVITLLAVIPRGVWAQSAQQRLEEFRRQQEEQRERQEMQRQAEERQRQMEEQRERQAEAQRQAEEMRRQQEEQRERQEMQRQAEERQRQMEEQRERQAEAQRQAEQSRRQQEEQRERQADFQRQAEERQRQMEQQRERQAESQRGAGTERQFPLPQQSIQQPASQLPVAPRILPGRSPELPGIVAPRPVATSPRPPTVNPAPVAVRPQPPLTHLILGLLDNGTPARPAAAPAAAPPSLAQAAANASQMIAIQRTESQEVQNAFDQLKLLIAQNTSDPNLAQSLLQSVGQPDPNQQALDTQLQALLGISANIAQQNAARSASSSSGGSASANSRSANQATGGSNPNDPNSGLNIVEGAPLQGSPADPSNNGGLNSGGAGTGSNLNGASPAGQNGSGSGLGGGPSSGAPAQPGCTWTQRSLTVTAWGQDYLYVNSDMMAGIVDGQGQAAFAGKYIQVSLGSSASQPAYFGLNGQLDHALTAGQQVTLPVTVQPANGVTEQPIVVKFCK